MMRILIVFMVLLFWAASPALAQDPFIFDVEDDRIMQIIYNIFGGILSDDISTTIIGDAFKVYTNLILSLAMAWLSYLVVIGMIKSANEGEAFGQSWSGMMGTLRIVGAFGMLLPVAGKGYSVIVYVVLMCAQLGIGMANTIWYNVVDNIAANNKPLSLTPSADMDAYSKSLSDIGMCISYLNFNNAAKGLSDRYSLSVKDENEKGILISAKKQSEVSDICGYVRVDFYPLIQAMSSNPKAVSPSSSNVRLINNMHASHNVKIIAETIGFYNNFLPKVATRKTVVSSSALQLMLDEYISKTNKLNRLYAEDVAKNAKELGRLNFQNSGDNWKREDKERKRFEIYAKETGWSSAGSLWLTMSSLNRQTMNLIGLRPKISRINEAKVYDILHTDNKELFEYLTTAVLVPSSSLKSDLTEASMKTALLAKIYNDPQDLDSIRTALDESLLRMLFDVIGIPIDKERLPSSISRDDIKDVDNLYKKIDEQDFALDPVSHLTDMGHRFITIGNYIYFGSMSVKVILETWFAAAEEGSKNLIVKVMTGGFSSIAAAGFGAVLANIIQMFTTVLEPIIYSFLIAGVYFAFVIPFLVSVHFIIGVLSWILLVVEAVFAAPLWMIIHISFNNDEFISRNMIPGWMILLSIIVKPSLMILGITISVAIYSATAYLVTSDFMSLVINITSGYYVGAVTCVAIVILLLASYVMVSKYALNVINGVPENILSKWLGGPATSGDEKALAEQTAGMIMAGQKLSDASRVGNLRQHKVNRSVNTAKGNGEKSKDGE